MTDPSDTRIFIAARDVLQQLLGYAATALDDAGNSDRDRWARRRDEWLEQLRGLDQNDPAACRDVLEQASLTLRALSAERRS